MLGAFDDALDTYRAADTPLRGDALLALGRLRPLLDQAHAPQPWDALWRAYRAHALCLAGRVEEGVALARALVPVDIYEWIHVFECLLRAGELSTLDMRSLLYRPPHTSEHRWAELARQRMRADHARIRSAQESADLGPTYDAVLEAYDRSGLPYERALTRLSYARWLLAKGEVERAEAVNRVTLALAERHRMGVLGADAWALAADLAKIQHQSARAEAASREAARLRCEHNYLGPARP
jgi:hypothetical protein